MGDMFAVFPGVFFSLCFRSWLAHGRTGKKGHGPRRFLFLVSFLRLLRLLCEALVGLRLVWVLGLGGRGRGMEQGSGDERK